MYHRGLGLLEEAGFMYEFGCAGALANHFIPFGFCFVSISITTE